jgi:hypothetical protein
MFQTAEEQAVFMQKEYDLFSPTFKDNKILIKVLRKWLLGIELSPTEVDLTKQIPQAVKDRIASLLLPSVNGDEEIHQVNDFWFQFNLKERSEYQVKVDIEYLPLVQDFFTNAIARLNGESAELTIKDLQYSKSVSKDQNIVNVIARNIILATTESLVSTIYTKANSKPLTEQEIKNAQIKNSTR